MAKRTLTGLITTVSLHGSTSVPLYQQLYDRLRESVLDGRLRPGARLPSTRDLATELGVSRNTVMNAYAQLLAEGYLEGRTGSGTYVSRSLPDDLLRAPYGDARAPRQLRSHRALSERGSLLAKTPANDVPARGAPSAFRVGVPALDQFPTEIWARLSSRRWRRLPTELLGYGDPAGYGPLRQAIADHLSASRAVRCSSEQVIVVSGSQQTLDLAARILLDPGDKAWVEDPGYAGARGALVGAGAYVVPVPVDQDGLDVIAGERKAPDARLVCVTPSHQHPLGITMSLSRRLALLEWASRAGSWILEDDYDSEYRYSGRPLESLQGLDSEGRVIYVGTFSKVLSPALRLGYLVAPPDLVDAFVAARELSDRHSPTVEQAILADFIAEGHFARHVRRTRALYAERQATLIEAAGRELEGLLDVLPVEAGMHLVGWLPNGVDGREASRQAEMRGVETQHVAPPCSGVHARSGLMLGYAAFLTRQRSRPGCDGLR